MNFLIRPSAEVAIKSKPVRRQQIRQLRQNISKLLRRVDDRIKVDGSWDRIDVQVPSDNTRGDKLIDLLQRIPGISNILVVQDYPFVDFDGVSERVLAVFGEYLKGKTFAVRVRRTGKHSFTSGDLERHLGGVLMENSEAAGVNLRQPDELVRVEVIDDRFHVVA